MSATSMLPVTSQPSISSLSSQRTSSRLSSLNPMRTSNFKIPGGPPVPPKPSSGSSASSASSISSSSTSFSIHQTAATPTPDHHSPPTHSHSHTHTPPTSNHTPTPTPHHTSTHSRLFPTFSNHSNHSHEENFQLKRLDSNSTINSNFSSQSKYLVTLNLSKRDIELIRYTWNKMLLEEPQHERPTHSQLPQMPGQFYPGQSYPPHTHHSQHNHSHNDSLTAQNMKGLSQIKQMSTSTVASSLFCRQFYGNLLAMSPGLEGYFPSIKHQAVAFAGVVSLAISQLDNLSSLDEYLTKLGKRHTRILNIEPEHFELMGEALIKTFIERFGIKFNHELEVLWIKLYMYLSNSILQYGQDPKLKLNKNDNTGSNPDHLFQTNQLDERSLLDTSSLNAELTRSSTLTDAGSSVNGQFSTRNGSQAGRHSSVSTAHTSIMNPESATASTDNVEDSGKKQKKRSRMSIRNKTKEGCVIV